MLLLLPLPVVRSIWASAGGYRDGGGVKAASDKEESVAVAVEVAEEVAVVGRGMEVAMDT